MCSVADPGCLFRIPNLKFFHSGSRVKKLRNRIKKFKYHLPFTMLDPGVKKASDPGSVILLMCSQFRILCVYSSNFKRQTIRNSKLHRLLLVLTSLKWNQVFTALILHFVSLHCKKWDYVAESGKEFSKFGPVNEQKR